jgi:hypothetical protein
MEVPFVTKFGPSNSTFVEYLIIDHTVSTTIGIEELGISNNYRFSNPSKLLSKPLGIGSRAHCYLSSVSEQGIR